jgi:phosphoglycolate phosphatase-like HAD superfamily hydrolase
MKLDLSRYASLVFDCDGVVLDSNRVKTEAFFSAAMPYGTAAATALVDYHRLNGGISRYVKLAYFLEAIVPQYAPEHVPGNDMPGLEDLLFAYAREVYSGLMACRVAEGLGQLRTASAGAPWLIVSGGDQEELRGIFAERRIDDYFDGGIFGSPDSKDIILAREIKSRNIKQPALFLGDSRYDLKASKAAGLDFVFISGWTEMTNWEEFVKVNNLHAVNSLASLLRSS